MKIACPNCGANVAFDVKKQKCYCEHCGKYCDIEKLEIDVNKLNDYREYICDFCGEKILIVNSNNIIKMYFVFEEKKKQICCRKCGNHCNLHESIINAKKEKNANEYICQSCGAKFHIPEKDVIVKCNYCDSEQIVTERLKKIIKKEQKMKQDTFNREFFEKKNTRKIEKKRKMLIQQSVIYLFIIIFVIVICTLFIFLFDFLQNII